MSSNSGLCWPRRAGRSRHVLCTPWRMFTRTSSDSATRLFVFSLQSVLDYTSSCRVSGGSRGSLLTWNSAIFYVALGSIDSSSNSKCFSSHEEALLFYARYDAQMQRDRETSVEAEQAALREQFQSRINELGLWIDPPQWKESYDAAAHSRATGTCSWVLQDPEYQAWKSQRDGGTKRVLSIQGKPGFGKTTLCPVVIDDLSASEIPPAGSTTSSPTNVVAYYFFNQQQHQESPGSAFRYLLAQVLHGLQHSQKAIDIASTLFDKRNLGQHRATDAEIFAVLQLLLKEFPRFYLVIDAVDECSDPEHFLDRLYIPSQVGSKKSVFSYSSVVPRSRFRIG
ncbi:hypothetical protein VTN96DRAFT_7548 [Rasamsonia emersonii]